MSALRIALYHNLHSGGAKRVAAEEVKGGVQATIRVSVEIEGEERPGCVVDTISRYFPA